MGSDVNVSGGGPGERERKTKSAGKVLKSNPKNVKTATPKAGKQPPKETNQAVSGRVNRISVKCVAGGPAEVSIEFSAKKDRKKTVLLDPSDTTALSAMLALAGAAAAANEKLHVRTAPGSDGGVLAVEMELRVKH